MEQLIDDSYDYLENHPEAVEHCESYIEDGYSVNKRMDEGGETVSSLLSAINSVTLSAPILVYRGLSEMHYVAMLTLAVGDSIPTTHFISTTIVKAIAEQHSEECVVAIRLEAGTHAFFLNAVNDLPGGGMYGTKRRVELLTEVVDGYEQGELDGDTIYANGEEEILLAPGILTCVTKGVYSYTPL